MWIDEETWPAAKELAGLRFESSEDFEKCWWLLAEHRGALGMVSWEDLVIEVRKSHKYLVDQAGLTYTDFELADLDDLPTEERLRWEREAVEYGRKALLERLRREDRGTG